MGDFEKGIGTALCVMSIAVGVLLAVLGFGGSYGSDSARLIFGALIFITVPAVMLFAMYGSEIKTKKDIDPVGIVVGVAIALVAAGTLVCMWMLGVLKEAGAWLLIPAVMLITGIYAVLKAIGVLKKKK